jgi:hypothetical protein
MRRWHLKMNHLSFAKLKLMALQGNIPKQLATTELHFCPTCKYSKSMRNFWKYKNNNNKIEEATQEGQCVFVDSFQSSIASFAAHFKGIYTNKKYRISTVFIDHYSDLSYVFMQHDHTSSEISRVKIALEQFAKAFGVNIQYYHADNGRFADYEFINHEDYKDKLYHTL